MPVPALYAWVESVPDKPKMMIAALNLLGTKELPGKFNNNPVILDMARDIGIAHIVTNDELAWCATSHNWVCLKSGKPLSGKGYDLVRAKSFETWGIAVRIPMFGDTLVFKRDGGYHVGLYLAEDLTHYHVLGGNQSNSYSIMRIEKKRLTAARRYYATAPPSSVKVITVAPNGIVSKNEA